MSKRFLLVIIILIILTSLEIGIGNTKSALLLGLMLHLAPLLVYLSVRRVFHEAKKFLKKY